MIKEAKNTPGQGLQLHFPESLFTTNMGEFSPKIKIPFGPYSIVFEGPEQQFQTQDTEVHKKI